jgi:nucleotide-binding universal stress UspA family protein
MKRFKNILFFADRHDGLSSTLNRIVALAISNNAKLTIMDVTPDSGLADYINKTYDIDLNAQLRDQRLQMLNQLVEPLSDIKGTVDTRVVTGIPFIEVIRAVQQHNHDLVVKVAQHDRGLTASLFGSTDMHLLRKCPCPVWIDHMQSEPVYHRILVAVDPLEKNASDLQHLIMDLATSLATQENAELEILHAWDLPGESLLVSGSGRISRTELDLILEHKEQHHRQALSELLAGYNIDSQADNVHLVKGRAADVISATVSERNIDLIVMGTLGRAGIPGLFIGNTAEEVLRKTKAAALTVKPSDFISPVE